MTIKYCCYGAYADVGCLDDCPTKAASKAWKVGNEFAPFHPSASHIEPAYRDGWNACYRAAVAAAPPTAAPAPSDLAAERERLAKLIEKATYRDRWLSAGMNSEPIKPCAMAALIRADGGEQK